MVVDLCPVAEIERKGGRIVSIIAPTLPLRLLFQTVSRNCQLCASLSVLQLPV